METIRKYVISICYSSADNIWLSENNSIDTPYSFVSKLKKKLNDIFDFFEVPLCENDQDLRFDDKKIIENTDIALLLITDSFSDPYISKVFLPFLNKEKNENNISIFPILASSLSEPTINKLQNLFSTYNVLPDNVHDLESIYASDHKRGEAVAIDIINNLFRKGKNMRIETDLYSEIKQKRSISLATKYIDDYKDKGIYINDVNKLLKSMLALQKEDDDYNRAVKDNTKVALKAFMIKYPKSKYRLQILTILERLDEEYNNEAKTEFEKLDKNDIICLRAFLEEYPNIPQSKKVKEYIANLEKDAYQVFKESDNITLVMECAKALNFTKYKDKVQDKIKRLDRKAYNKALKKGTVEAFKEYLTLCPEGEYTEIAKKKIRSVKKMNKFKKNWKKVSLIFIVSVALISYPFYKWILIESYSLHCYVTGIHEQIPFELEYEKLDKIDYYDAPIYSYVNYKICKDVSHEDTLVWNGIRYTESGMIEKAREAFEKATYSPSAMYNLAVLYLYHSIRNDDKGNKYMKLATAMGHPIAEFHELLKPYKELSNTVLPPRTELMKIKDRLHQIADKGYKQANLSLGNIYFRLGDEKNAIENYRIAAPEGYAAAIKNLIKIYNKNKQLETAYSFTEDMFNLNNHNYELNFVKDLYIAYTYHGIGCKEDKEKAFSVLKDICDKDISFNNKTKQLSLAKMYYNGYGTAMDKEAAFKILYAIYYDKDGNLLTNLGSAFDPDLYHLAQLFFLSDFSTDYAKAIECYDLFIQKTSDKELKKDALYALGRLHTFTAYGHRDMHKARTYYDQGAHLDDKRAHNALGVLYSQRKALNDPEKSAYHFQQVINDDKTVNANATTNAYYNLGRLYYYGMNGYPRKPDLAKEYLQKALERGCENAKPILSDKRLWIELR
ncbi:tetratricopeptide repeat protein [Prevotella sp. 10(H)]|uniref:tetratricopeptide repeat protein n=1 Tax=Prevotella sp. 10(H) TaxID=1158294 RepID=UPI0004A6AE29|nr:tetratricopeptide repeat protein [Prevotella sp. 10(H)]